MATKDKMFRILSIDGGGIRGILPGQILVALEEKLQKATRNPKARLAEYFDLMAGTSTGGILSCLYACPDSNGKPRFSAKEAVDLYLQFGTQIFSIPAPHYVTSLGGLRRAKYPSQSLEALMKDYFGDLRLSDTVTNLIITAFHLDHGDAKFFTSFDAQDPERNLFLREVARSTSAAPTYFPPSLAGATPESLSGFIDGGVFANNPTMCAIVEAYKIDVHLHQKQKLESRNIGGLKSGNHSALENVFTLSIGTSDYESKYPFEKAKNWGTLGWIQPVIDIMMSGVSETVAYQAEQLFRLLRIQQIESELDDLQGETGMAAEIRRHELLRILEFANNASVYHKEGAAVANFKPKPQYIRINPKVAPAQSAMDDASPENLQNLKIAGENAAKEYDLWLDIAVEWLLR